MAALAAPWPHFWGGNVVLPGGSSPFRRCKVPQYTNFHERAQIVRLGLQYQRHSAAAAAVAVAVAEEEALALAVAVAVAVALAVAVLEAGVQFGVRISYLLCILNKN